MWIIFCNVVWLYILCACLLKVWEWQIEKTQFVGGKISRQNMIKLRQFIIVCVADTIKESMTVLDIHASTYYSK